jgi:hypothetical protein
MELRILLIVFGIIYIALNSFCSFFCFVEKTLTSRRGMEITLATLFNVTWRY